MSPEEAGEARDREIRVEGTGLVLLVGALVAALAGAFLGGVWFGRSSSPAPSEAPAAAGAAAPESAPEASAKPSYFDTAGGDHAAEPDRQVRGATPSPTPSPTPSAPPPAVTPGSYFVQVFAGRDRRAAETLVQSLTTRGYPVRMDTQREGRDALYKVRVGGYPTQDDARTAADRLKKEGETGAWVTQIR